MPGTFGPPFPSVLPIFIVLLTSVFQLTVVSESFQGEPGDFVQF